jgi:hypothetical protein
MTTSKPKPPARFVLSRMPQGAWLSMDEFAAILDRAGIDYDARYMDSVVRSLRRRGQLRTNALNQVMRPASRTAA